jgi:outer membrane protein assembly factor BamB
MSYAESKTFSRRAMLAASAGSAAAIGLGRAPLAFAGSSKRPCNPWRLPAHDLAASRASAVTVGSVSERWRAHLAGGITGAPVVSDGGVWGASFGGDVGAFDLATGTQRWLRSLGTAIYGADKRELGFFGGIAVHGNRTVVASDRARCLDARTGATIWEANPLRGADGDDYFWAPPVIAGRAVLIGSGAGSEATQTRGRLTAYSLETGKLLWSTPMVPEGQNGGGILGQASVDLHKGKVYVATGAPYVPQPGDNPGTDSLVELRLRDGTIVWSDQVHAGDQLGLDLNSSPVLVGNLVFVAGKDGFRAWNRRTRRRLWHIQTTPNSPAPGAHADPTTGPEGGPIASDGKRVYGLSNDSAAGTCVAAAIDPWKGTVLWQTTLPAFSFAAPAVSKDAIAVPGSDGTLRLLAPATGALLAELPLSEPSSGAPSVTDNTLLVGTGAGAFLPGDSLVSFASS